jgi:hypothetical protein
VGDLCEASRKEEIVFRNTLLGALFLAILPQCIFPLVTAVQDPIRVQSNEVLVPTVVFDRELYAQLNKIKPYRRDSYSHLVEKNEKLWDGPVAKDLTARDFHLYEDGQEQKIQSSKLEPSAFRVVQDSMGKHAEFVSSGGGLWAYPDLPITDLSTWLAWPHYVIAYVPPKSAVGSCHHIEVRVGRPNLTVWTRGEYCNTPHPASDPLEGTEFGNNLEKAASSSVPQTSIDLKLNVAVFANNANGAHVYVTTSFPWQSLQHEFRDGTLYATIGSLVMVYKKDGTLAARYSDFACCDYGEEKESSIDTKSGDAPAAERRLLLPDRYETQFLLPAGEYIIHAVISDGVHFGKREAALTAEGYDPAKLGISDVVLSRRVRKLSTDSTMGAAQVADSYTPLISNGVEFAPLANTQFWPDETLFAYFEINDPLAAGQPSGKVKANMRIVDASTGAVADTFAPVDTATYTKASSPVIAIGRGVLLKGLPPGAYRLEVRANDAAGKSTAWRSAEFTLMAAAPLELK